MSDLISRQAAINAIMEWGLIDGLAEGQAIEILTDEEKLSSFNCSEIPTGWIPCSERLPEEDGDYLVTFEKGYAEDYGFYSMIGIAPFDVDCEGFGIWQEYFDHISLGSLGREWVDISVVAWMPLPEPYERGEDNA